MRNRFLVGMAALLLATCGAIRASAQQCPRPDPTGPATASKARTLRGRLIYHDGIRQWFELKLDRPACGKDSIELIEPEGGSKLLQNLRGCHVDSDGTIDFSPTGYYSLDLFQDPARVKPVGACVKQPLFADHSHARPGRHVHGYTVEMLVDYRPGDHPVKFHVRSGRRILRPWQAYANYLLTGGLVLYGLCGRGFAVDKVFGTPAARPSHFAEPRDSGDMAAFDPETAAQSGKTDLHLGFSCIRAH